MSLYHYFKPADASHKSVLPSLDGEMSLKIPSSSIEAANKKVAPIIEIELKTATVGASLPSNKRGTYEKYSATQKAMIGSSAWHLSSNKTFQE